MTLHDFKVEAIDGSEYDLAQLKGIKVIVVNTASECGFTPQYALLQEMYTELDRADFEIIGFPANNFGAQEPGSNDDIAAFCSSNYQVSFPMMAKISVLGDDQHPVYRWFTHKSENGVEDVELVWNFQKFLVDEDGNYVRSVSHVTSPMDETILDWLRS
jgi:glutathione peroxidase